MIQDTTFVVDLLRGDEDAMAFHDLLERGSRPQKLASITVFELYEGLIRAGTPAEERSAIQTVLDSKSVVEADADIMRSAGRVSGELLNGGERIDREDCIIAATALREDEPVVTRNAEHFERVDGVEIRTY